MIALKGDLGDLFFLKGICFLGGWKGGMIGASVLLGTCWRFKPLAADLHPLNPGLQTLLTAQLFRNVLKRSKGL